MIIEVLNSFEQMNRSLAKKLKASDGISVPFGVDSFSQRLENDMAGLADGSIRNMSGMEVERQNGVGNIQTTGADNEAQVNLSAEGKANSISENTGFSGYSEAPCENAGNNSASVLSAGAVVPYDISTLDERQLKRERRKQANRESARKSRLRKQYEYEELVKKWESLKEENSALKSELEHLNAESEKVRQQNAALMEKLENSGVPQNGEMISSNAEADSTQTSDTGKLQEKSDIADRVQNSDNGKHENSNSEAKLHHMLESSSRGDNVTARLSVA